MKRLPVYILCCLFVVSACGADEDPGSDDGTGDDTGDEIASYSLSGSVVDFETLEKIDGQAAVATNGIAPPPAVSVQGADFEITQIPPGSVFHVLGSALGYHSTYARAFEIIDASVSQADIPVVSEAYLSSLFEAYELPLAAGGIVIAQMLGDDGAPLAGVSADAFEINNAADFIGPFFLDEQMAPDPRLDATSASGYVVFFGVEPGLIAINAAADSGYSMSMTPAPIASTTVTLARVEALAGDATEVPVNVSFKDDVLPIFEMRGCAACHSKKEIGNEIGGLSLDMKDKKKLYKEVAEEISGKYVVARIDLQTPEASLMLTQPSAEDPPDSHPNVTFRGASDPDYQMILSWIREGAKNN